MFTYIETSGRQSHKRSIIRPLTLLYKSQGKSSDGVSGVQWVLCEDVVSLKVIVVWRSPLQCFKCFSNILSYLIDLRLLATMLQSGKYKTKLKYFEFESSQTCV